MYKEDELSKKQKEVREIMAGRELNEQVKVRSKMVRQAVVEGGQEACIELGFAPDSDEAKDIMSNYVYDYLMGKRNRDFISKQGSNYGSIKADVKEKIVEEYQTANQSGGEVDFRDNQEEIVKRLRNNVVRLVFTKRNGDTRVMYATLNPEIIDLYNTHKRKYGERGMLNLADVDRSNSENRDFVRVLDVEKEEFRAFKPSTLQDYDNEYSVPSWIESHPDNDAWYLVAKEGEDVRDHVNAQGVFEHRDAGDLRARRERGYIQEAQDNGTLVDEETARDLEFIQHNMNRTVKGYLYTLTSHDVPEEVQEYINSNQFFRDMREMLVGIRVYVQEELNDDNYDISKSPQKHQNGGAYTIVIGTDTFIFHPYFIVNTRTGKVYLDRMGWVKPSQATNNLPLGVRRIDRLAGGLIEQFIEDKGLRDLPLPRKKRIRKSDKTYEIRHARMIDFVNNMKKNKEKYQDFYEKDIASYKIVPSNGTVQLKFKRPLNGLVFEVSPTSIIGVDLDTKEPVRLVSVQRGTSTLRELTDGLNAYKNKYQGTPHEARVNRAVGYLHEIFIQNLFNLRRKYPEKYLK